MDLTSVVFKLGACTERTDAQTGEQNMYFRLLDRRFVMTVNYSTRNEIVKLHFSVSFAVGMPLEMSSDF